MRSGRQWGWCRPNRSVPVRIAAPELGHVAALPGTPHSEGNWAGCIVGRAVSGPSFLCAEAPAAEGTDYQEGQQRNLACRRRRIALVVLAEDRTAVPMGGCNHAAARSCRSSPLARQHWAHWAH